MILENDLTTVRIMAINVSGYESQDILIVSTLEKREQRLLKTKVFVKEEKWNKDILEVADFFYSKIVKHREMLRKKVNDKHLYNAYMEISQNRHSMFGIKQLYLKDVKSPMSILKRPRKGYKVVQGDTLRLFIRDLVLEEEKKIYQGEL